MVSNIDPNPKAVCGVANKKRRWAAVSVLDCVGGDPKSDLSFDQVQFDRRSNRSFDSVSLEDTCGVIKRVFGIQMEGAGAQANRVRKSIISAGALHPIDVVIVAGPEVEEPIVFDDLSNKFFGLPVLDGSALKKAISRAYSILPETNGHLLVFVGDVTRVSAHYSNPISLLWRDAGAALQACSMASFAYGYAFCPLGALGEDVLSAIACVPPGRAALGMAIIGRS